MASNARSKAKVYGKKKRPEDPLIAGFEDLKITPSPNKGIAVATAQKGRFGGLTVVNTEDERSPLAPTSHNAATHFGAEEIQQCERKDQTELKQRASSPIEQENRLHTSRDVEGKRCTRDVAGRETLPECQVKDVHVEKRGHRPIRHKRPQLSRTVDSQIIPGISTLTSLESVDPQVKNMQYQCKWWARDFKITKIAQGSYAAILRMQSRKDPQEYVIGKLMPLKPSTGRGSRAEGHTSIEDATTEVKALTAMSLSPGFVGFREAFVLTGPLSKEFRKAYEDWEKNLPEEELEDARTELDYPENQLWLFIEMTDAGTDLETLLLKGFPDGTMLHSGSAGQRLTIQQSWDIFWGIAEALSHGEEHANFEHRDLHPGNVCIKKSATCETSAKKYEQIEEQKSTIFEITLIDYTLSRATLADGEILANSMKDRGLFEQVGENATDKMQYDMYRHMRDLVETKRGGKQNRATMWQQYSPMTNVLWLYHILIILIKETAIPSQTPAETARFMGSQENILFQALGDLPSDMRPDIVNDWIFLSAKDLVYWKAYGRAAYYLEIVRQDGLPIPGESETMHKARRRRLANIKGEMENPPGK